MDRSRSSAGVLAAGLIEWTHAETVEAKAAAVRVAEVLNLIQATLTKR